MSVDGRLLYEARMRPRWSAVAGIGGALLLVAAVVQAVGPQPRVNEVTVQLIATNQRAGLEVLGAVLNGLGVLGLAAALWFLFEVTRARRPELPPWTRMAALIGGILAACGGIAYGVVITVKAHQFVTQGAQTYQQANHLLSSAAVAGLQYGGLIGSLLLAVAFVLVSLNAMRVGLLTRFMGYLGIVAAAASLLLIGSPPALLLQVFWLLAVAYLLSGRWPSGVPPSWASGRAEPWPSAQELREQRVQAAGGQPAQPEPEPKEVVGAGAVRATRSTTPKRKRKRRR